MIRTAWWLGGEGENVPSIVLERSAPSLEIASVDATGEVDPRIALRLSRLNVAVEPVASRDSHLRGLPARVASGDTVLVTDRSAIGDSLAQLLNRSGGFLDADWTANPREPLAWLEARAREPGARDPAMERRAWANLRRVTARGNRIVALGPDAGDDDARAVSGEILALDPEVTLRFPGALRGPALVALDDPVRHLGPSRTAAALRDGVIDLLRRTATLFLCVPATASGLVRSRMSQALLDRLVVVDVGARMDPGPATLIAAAATLADAVDILGFTGRALPLGDDETALHPAYARSDRAPADLSDVLEQARRSGAGVFSLSPTAHPGLDRLFRGRAPTRLTLDGVDLGEAAARFDERGPRHVLVRRTGSSVGVWVGPSESASPGPPVALFAATADAGLSDASPAALSWPEGAHERADAILNVADGTAPTLVATDPVPPDGPASGVPTEALRAAVGDGRCPVGPFENEDDERRALFVVLRLLERDLDRRHLERLAALGREIVCPVVLAAGDADWTRVNPERLSGRTIAVLDPDAARVPGEVAGGARPLIALAIPDAETAAGAFASVPAGALRVVALTLSHLAAKGDVVFDPADVEAQRSDPPAAVAVQLLRGLHAQFIVPFGIAAADLGTPGQDLLVPPAGTLAPEEAARHLHDAFRDGDLADVPRMLLVLGEDAPLEDLERIFGGAGDSLLTVATIGEGLRLVEGDRLTSGVRFAVPAYAPDDPAVPAAVADFAPAVAISCGAPGIEVPAGLPVVALGSHPSNRTAAATIDLPRPGEDGERSAGHEAALDRARLRLARAVTAVASRAEAEGHDPAAAAGRDAPAPDWEAEDEIDLADKLPRPRGRQAPSQPADGSSGEAAVPGPGRAKPWIGRMTAAIAATDPRALYPRSPGGKGSREVTRTTRDKGEPSMADTAPRPDAGFSSLWPVTGNVFLVFFAGWLSYMGWMSEMADLKTAFYGLAGVTGLVLFLGLWAAFTRSFRRDARPATQAQFDLSAERGFEPASPTPQSPVGALAPADDGMPVNPRTRAAAAPPPAAPPAADPLPAVRDAAADGEGRASSAAGPLSREPSDEDARSVPDTPGGGPPTGDIAEALRQLQSWMSREKAERGAQLARVDARLSSLEARIGATDVAAPDRDASERLSALEARVRTMEPETASGIARTVAELGSRVAAIESDARPSDADRAAGDVAARLDALERKTSEQANAAVPEDVAQRLSALESTVTAVRKRAEESASSLAGRLAALEERSAGEGAGGGDGELSARLAAVEERLGGGEGAAEASLAERLDALEARVAALSHKEEGTADLSSELEQYMKISAFNNIVNKRLIPQLQQLVERRIEERTSPDVLQEKVASLLPAEAGEGRTEAAEPARLGALEEALEAERAARRRLEEELVSVRANADTAASSVPTSLDPGAAERLASLEAAVEVERLGRKELEKALAVVRAAADEATSVVSSARSDTAPGEAVAALSSALDEDRARIAAIEDALAANAGAGAVPPAETIAALGHRVEAVEQRAAARIDEANRTVEQMRENLAAITRHVARMGEHYQDISRRLEGEGQRPEGQASTPAVHADVEALRDALTTIIEQNREIRAQQDLLSARLPNPAGSAGADVDDPAPRS